MGNKEKDPPRIPCSLTHRHLQREKILSSALKKRVQKMLILQKMLMYTLLMCNTLHQPLHLLWCLPLNSRGTSICRLPIMIALEDSGIENKKDTLRTLDYYWMANLTRYLERCFVATGMAELPRLDEKVKQYGFEWMTRVPGRYSPALVGEFYVVYKVELQRQYPHIYLWRGCDPISSLFIQGVQVNIFSYAISRFCIA